MKFKTAKDFEKQLRAHVKRDFILASGHKSITAIIHDGTKLVSKNFYIYNWYTTGKETFDEVKRFIENALAGVCRKIENDYPTGVKGFITDIVSVVYEEQDIQGKDEMATYYIKEYKKHDLNHVLELIGQEAVNGEPKLGCDVLSFYNTFLNIEQC